jgi:hypothetical protein
MLSIDSTANSNGVPQLSTDFLVASIEIIDDQTLKVWLTRPFLNGTSVNNYTLSGPQSANIVLAQYDTDPRAVRLYVDVPLAVGQWTIEFLSGPPLSLISDDSDHETLSPNTQIVFDLVDKSSQGSVGTNLVEGSVSKFIPRNLRDKSVWAAIIAGLEATDSIVSQQARLAFDQYFISTASGSYLDTKARDRGVQKPEKLGISDVDFRRLVIDVSNSKLTEDSLLSVLEMMYGSDSVRGYVETAIEGPFEVFDGAYLDVLIDGNQSYHFIAKWVDYEVPLRATCVELCSALNHAFDKNGIKAYSVIEKNKIRIYSKTKGLRSSVTVVGGTLQASLQFEEPVYGAITSIQHQSLDWEITNPSAGIVRFAPSTIVFDFTSPVLKIGDYVTIMGSNFPEELRGSWPITNISFIYSGITPLEWFEIASSYVVP